jgi:hypothetical protein
MSAHTAAAAAFLCSSRGAEHQFDILTMHAAIKGDEQILWKERESMLSRRLKVVYFQFPQSLRTRKQLGENLQGDNPAFLCSANNALIKHLLPLSFSSNKNLMNNFGVNFV